MSELLTGRLASLLREKGMSQKELAEKTGITPATISRYVNNERERLIRAILQKD